MSDFASVVSSSTRICYLFFSGNFWPYFEFNRCYVFSCLTFLHSSVSIFFTTSNVQNGNASKSDSFSFHMNIYRTGQYGTLKHTCNICLFKTFLQLTAGRLGNIIPKPQYAFKAELKVLGWNGWLVRILVSQSGDPGANLWHGTWFLLEVTDTC